MNILFMGTPEFAVPSLRALTEAGHTIVGVFTQPDKPKNRGMKLEAPPVKQFALAHEIPVFQPTKLRDGTALEQIRALSPDLIVVAAYGRILPDDILAEPKLGCINVHSSLLPKYRGAAPINWAVLNGETESGVTIMHMAHDLDAGDIILQSATTIGADETAEELYHRLAELGGELVVQAVEAIRDGTAPRLSQDETKVTLAPMLDKSLSPVDWTRSAHAIHCQVRGLLPWPVASTGIIHGEMIKLYAVQETGEHTEKAPGTIVEAGKKGISVACGDGAVLQITQLQAPGKKRMSAADYLRGHPISVE